MKKFIPYIIIAALLAVIYFIWSPKHSSNSIPNKGSTAISDKMKTEPTHKDPSGQNHVLTNNDQNNITKGQLLDPTRPKSAIDTAAIALNIALGKIEQYEKVKFSLEGKLLRAERSIDSVKKEKFFWQNQYLQVSYTPRDPATVDRYPNGYFDYAYHGDLQSLKYKKSNVLRRILGTELSYTDYFMSDTSAYVSNDLRRLTVIQDDKLWGAKIQAASTFLPGEGISGFGGGVKINLGRLDLGASRLYFPRSKTWSNVITANIDLYTIR